MTQRDILRLPNYKGRARTLLEAVAADYGLTPDDLTGPCRMHRIAHPRQELMWLLYRQGNMSLPQIGRFLGGRNHTTIKHGVERHQERIEAAHACKKMGVA